jgi:hypothetical protein
VAILYCHSDLPLIPYIPDAPAGMLEKTPVDPTLIYEDLLYYVTLVLTSLHILINPVFSNHLSYVTIFQPPLGRSHKAGLTVCY